MSKQPQIKVEGLREVIASLRKLAGDELPGELKRIHKDAASMVAARASAKAPVVSGKLAGSYRGTGAQRYGTVKGGGASVPYAGWIDFGGSRRGNNGSVANRAFLKEGRIIFPALMELEPKIIDMYSKALEDLAQRFNNS